MLQKLQQYEAWDHGLRSNCLMFHNETHSGSRHSPKIVSICQNHIPALRVPKQFTLNSSQQTVLMHHLPFAWNPFNLATAFTITKSGFLGYLVPYTELSSLQFTLVLIMNA